MNNDNSITDTEWKSWMKDFLKEWFNGLMEGIKEIQDEKIQNQIMAITGRVCAQSHAKAIFERVWKKTKPNLSMFLDGVNEEFGADIYTLVSENEVIAIYEHCYCPLVNDIGVVDSPLLCYCSPNWIKENFESVLEKEVEVKTHQTVLRGADTCKFTIIIND